MEPQNDRKDAVRPLAALGFSLLSGLLLAFSLPPFDQEWLGWIALAPLLLAVRQRRRVEALGLGLLAGVVCGAVHRFLYTPFLLLALVLGAVSCLAALASRRWTGLPWVLCTACLGVAAEWATTFAPMPVHLALCQYRSLAVIQVAALTGVWGVSFLLWWLNSALADWASQRRLVSVPLLFGAALLVANLVYGFWALIFIGIQDREAISDGRSIRAAAIQDFTESDAPSGWHGNPPPEELDREALTRRAVGKGARLVVWSEECLGASFNPLDRRDATRSLARNLGIFLVAGYQGRSRDAVHNCAALIGPDGKVLGTHRKLHLFPSERGIVPGREARAFDTSIGRIGMEICFDSCYTGVTRALVRDGARLIAMPNLDPVTPLGSLHLLHGTMLPFRAVENGVPFVRADPTGLSQIVTRRGEIVAQSPLFAADALVSQVAPGDGQGTPFTRLGDWLAYLCLLATAAFALEPLRKQAPPARVTNGE